MDFKRPPQIVESAVMLKVGDLSQFIIVVEGKYLSFITSCQMPTPIITLQRVFVAKDLLK
jgi:hypothetical protein